MSLREFYDVVVSRSDKTTKVICKMCKNHDIPAATGPCQSCSPSVGAANWDPVTGDINDPVVQAIKEQAIGNDRMGTKPQCKICLHAWAAVGDPICASCCPSHEGKYWEAPEPVVENDPDRPRHAFAKMLVAMNAHCNLGVRLPCALCNHFNCDVLECDEKLNEICRPGSIAREWVMRGPDKPIVASINPGELLCKLMADIGSEIVKLAEGDKK